MERGRIHLYCGEGKGKTTAAMGLAARAAGQGVPVVIAQFLKANTSAELKVLKASPCVFAVNGPEQVKFTFAMTSEEKQEFQIIWQQVFQEAARLCREKEAGLLVLDEAIGAINKEMLPLEQVTGFLKARPDKLEVVLTGREPVKELTELADYITEMKKIRHPFDYGQAAKKGIEY